MDVSERRGFHTVPGLLQLCLQIPVWAASLITCSLQSQALPPVLTQNTICICLAGRPGTYCNSELVWSYTGAGQQPPCGTVASIVPAFELRKQFGSLSTQTWNFHGIFHHWLSLQPPSYLCFVKFGQNWPEGSKVIKERGGEQMDERGIDRQHDLIIPAGIGIQAELKYFRSEHCALKLLILKEQASNVKQIFIC